MFLFAWHDTTTRHALMPFRRTLRGALCSRVDRRCFRGIEPETESWPDAVALMFVRHDTRAKASAYDPACSGAALRHYPEALSVGQTAAPECRMFIGDTAASLGEATATPGIFRSHAGYPRGVCSHASRLSLRM